jgi:hypothetical protein
MSPPYTNVLRTPHDRRSQTERIPVLIVHCALQHVSYTRSQTATLETEICGQRPFDRTRANEPRRWSKSLSRPTIGDLANCRDHATAER